MAVLFACHTRALCQKAEMAYKNYVSWRGEGVCLSVIYFGAIGVRLGYYLLRYVTHAFDLLTRRYTVQPVPIIVIEANFGRRTRLFQLSTFFDLLSSLGWRLTHQTNTSVNNELTWCECVLTFVAVSHGTWLNWFILIWCVITFCWWRVGTTVT